MDLRKGYHQILVNLANIPITATIAPFGLFEYKRLPFDLQNARAAFARMDNTPQREVEAAFAFVDNVLVCSVDTHCTTPISRTVQKPCNGTAL